MTKVSKKHKKPTDAKPVLAAGRKHLFNCVYLDGSAVCYHCGVIKFPLCDGERHMFITESEVLAVSPACT